MYIPDELNKLPSCLSFGKSLAPHGFHMPHSLLVKQELKDRGILDTFIRADVIGGLRQRVVHADRLDPFDLSLVLIDNLGELVP